MGHIVVTGGSGKAGQFVIKELLNAGHIILNLDLMPLEHPDVHTLKTDLADSGQVFNALSGQWALREPFPEGLPPRPDAVIHLAGYARNMLVPDNETFRSNTEGTYNIIEAACKLGIRKIIIASSVTVYGVAFAQGDTNFPSFPIHEDLDVNPTDTYAIAKLCGERVARGFAARFGVDIYILRIGRVIEPEEYNQDIFYSYVHEPTMWKVHGWSYIDARDLGGMCEAALRTDGLGFQVFNATNDHITNLSPTRDFLKSQFPDIPITREMEEFEAPFSNAKIKKLLGFQEKHPWHKYFSNWEKKQIEMEETKRVSVSYKNLQCWKLKLKLKYTYISLPARLGFSRASNIPQSKSGNWTNNQKQKKKQRDEYALANIVKLPTQNSWGCIIIPPTSTSRSLLPSPPQPFFNGDHPSNLHHGSGKVG
ncbi:hypothetical protein ACN42_g604 [Penicillium freii]|uniref:NAD-dependent epimerase/dehydratase domain-containing protein n=1 Tax=Penicillium freii TaxID=48697 RepID=A0A124GT88_PENFR|nr:hypothetical protein ACN42_g604 [Penicillium freii]